jgi:hypothetical protein
MIGEKGCWEKEAVTDDDSEDIFIPVKNVQFLKFANPRLRRQLLGFGDFFFKRLLCL